MLCNFWSVNIFEDLKPMILIVGETGSDPSLAGLGVCSPPAAARI